MEKFGSGINIPDPQHWFFYRYYRWFDYYTAEPLSCLAAGEGDGLHDRSAPDHRLGGGGESGGEYAHRHKDHSQPLPVRVPQLLAQICRRQNGPLGSLLVGGKVGRSAAYWSATVTHFDRLSSDWPPNRQHPWSFVLFTGYVILAAHYIYPHINLLTCFMS
jgi:hypothetical protein